MEAKQSTGRGRRYYGAAFVAAVLALLILVNLIISAFATRFGWYLYAEESYEHTIGDASYAFFEDVPEGEQVRVIFCMAEEELEGDVIFALVLNTFRQLAERHSFVSIEFVNIYLNPGKVKPFRERVTATGEKQTFAINERSVIFTTNKEGSDFRVESLQSFFILNSSQTITAYNGEETALACLAWALRDEHPVAAFTGEHGENYDELHSLFTTLLAAGYDVAPLDLSTGEIPEGVKLVVIANPRWDFERGAGGVRAELDYLGAFLDRGGSLFVSLDPYVKMNLSNLRAFLAERGLTATQDVIHDSQNSVTTDGYTLLTSLSDSTAATSLSGRIGAYTDSRVLVREAAAIECSTVGAWVAEPLLRTADTAELYRNGVLTGTGGGYPVLAVSRATQGEVTSTVLLSSSVYFLANDALNSSTYANRDMLLASLELATGEKTPVGCRILAINNERLEDLTMGTARLYAALCSLVLPLVVAGVGIFVLIRRKNR